jgi:hypothetical protein
MAKIILVAIAVSLGAYQITLFLLGQSYDVVAGLGYYVTKTVYYDQFSLVQ